MSVQYFLKDGTKLEKVKLAIKSNCNAQRCLNKLWIKHKLS